MKNKRVRSAMLQAGINQAQLAELLGVTPAELSIMLKYEMAAKEQSSIVAKIKENYAVPAC